MGQTIVLNTLVTEVPAAIPSLTGRLVMGAGAADLRRIAGSSEVEHILRGIWSKAIVRTIYLAVAFAAAAIPFAIGMEWLNAKKIAQQRKCQAESSEESSAMDKDGSGHP